MAQQKNKDLLSRLADRGEQVVGRITDLPGAKNLIDRTSQLAKSLDDVQKRLRSLGPLEKRVASIEKRLDKLEGKSTTRKRPATRRTTSPRSTTPKRPPSSS
jgi:TolA-binding protein